jgi:cytochrome P450
MHLAHGVHHCLGAPRARPEGRIALGGPIARTPRSTMTGLAVLPVRLR